MMAVCYILGFYTISCFFSTEREDYSVEMLSGGDMVARALEDEGVEFLSNYQQAFSLPLL
jgi:hypothetical protein